MSTLPEENNWEAGIYLIEEIDLVRGGIEGISNRQARELANRTLWLKNSQRGFHSDLTLVTATKTLIYAEIINKLILVNGSATIQLTLPSIDVSLTGIKACIQNNSLFNVTVSGTLRFDVVNKSNIYLAAGETIELVWIGDKWLVREYMGNLKDVGSTFFDYKQRQNTLVCNGAAINRADYPRLWEFAQTLGSSLITDADWNGIPGNKGFFSSGNGSSTFRLPDLRSMFIRGLDLGAGIDIGRMTELPGGFEPDEFKLHNHVSGSPLQNPGDPRQSDHYTKRLSTDLTGPNEYSYINRRTDDAGGLETRPKNIGLLPLIKV
ncbi:phage tail protein [Pedobacter sp. Hv1]|uniref:phage tail protein n=1 Tax=Pedobacter sp. Hv1 TaxID=1740090 RepID=UPI0006D8BBB8|nr:phage tail protein [Pedobacter sp. Hv1]KQC02108.1 hypothetical protein AQF98_00605 [Pedobacter sp. Hv1]